MNKKLLSTIFSSFVENLLILSEEICYNYLQVHKEIYTVSLHVILISLKICPAGLGEGVKIETRRESHPE